MSYPARFISTILILLLILSPLAKAKEVRSDIENKSGPVVKVKTKNVESSPIQQEDFDKLLAEGKRLYLEEMDNEAAL